jgi:hypothetical protein
MELIRPLIHRLDLAVLAYHACARKSYMDYTMGTLLHWVVNGDALVYANEDTIVIVRHEPSIGVLRVLLAASRDGDAFAKYAPQFEQAARDAGLTAVEFSSSRPGYARLSARGIPPFDKYKPVATTYRADLDG